MVGADVRLSDISKTIANITIGDAGYGFLIDSGGRVLGMGERGYTDFGITPEVVAPNESPKQIVLGKGPTALQDATDKMRRGGSGLGFFQTARMEVIITLRTPRFQPSIIAWGWSSRPVKQPVKRWLPQSKSSKKPNNQP